MRDEYSIHRRRKSCPECQHNRRRDRAFRVDSQERNPGDVLKERSQERPVTEAILEQRKSDVTCTREDHCTSEPDLETVQEETIDLDAPPEQQVVH